MQTLIICICLSVSLLLPLAVFYSHTQTPTHIILLSHESCSILVSHAVCWRVEHWLLCWKHMRVLIQIAASDKQSNWTKMSSSHVDISHKSLDFPQTHNLSNESSLRCYYCILDWECCVVLHLSCLRGINRLRVIINDNQRYKQYWLSAIN